MQHPELTNAIYQEDTFDGLMKLMSENDDNIDIVGRIIFVSLCIAKAIIVNQNVTSLVWG